MLFCHLLIFFQNQLLKKIFQEYHQIVKRFVGPDQGPNCLEKLTADDTISRAKTTKTTYMINKRVKM